jgi:hypothetical protein
LYTSCMLRGAFTLFIKFSTYLSKKKILIKFLIRSWSAVGSFYEKFWGLTYH